MTSPLLDIPDDPAVVPGWLEAELLGPRLGRLVAELDAVHRPASEPLFDDVLAAHAPAVLARGLAALPRPALRLLLRNPVLLAELRDLVLADGGPYWDRYLVTPETTAAADRVAERVRTALAPAEPTRPRGRWLGYAGTAAATAAAVLAAVYLLGGVRGPALVGPDRPPEVAQAGGWGLARVGALPPADDTATLAALARLADEWKKKRPETPTDLARRLVEFREGCAAIQLATDLPLTDANRRWLRLRCADWADEVDAHLRALEATRDVPAVRAAADATADRIARELRARAVVAGA